MRRGKYNVAEKEDRTMDNIVFDSKREMARYAELKMLERSQVISELMLQPRFPLVVNRVLVCTYVADFAYTDRDGRRVIEDVKGARTALFILKSKLFMAVTGLRILET